MGRVVTAHVELGDGRDFVAEIANLTPNSVFIHTAEPLSFRSQVTVTFFSVSIRAELALVARDPVGWVVVFSPDAETRARIEARIPAVTVIGPMPVGAGVLDEETLQAGSAEVDPSSRATLRGNEIRFVLQHLESNSLREALQSTGGIPVVQPAMRALETDSLSVPLSVPGEKIDDADVLDSEPISAQDLLASQEMPEVTIRPPFADPASDAGLPDLPIEEPSEVEGRTMPAIERPRFEEEHPASKEKPGTRRPIPHARTVRMRPTPGAPGPARSPRRRDLTRREDPSLAGVRHASTSLDLPAINGAVLTDIPVLADDESTVIFASPAQYLLQHRTNIAHGAIVVRSRPIPIGTAKTLHLSVPGVLEPYTLQAKVILSTDDSIGLSIDHFDEHAAALEALTS